MKTSFTYIRKEKLSRGSQLQIVFNRQSERELQQEAMGIFDCSKDPFAAVSTTYRQDSVIKEKFSFVEAKQYDSSMLSQKGKKEEISA